MTSIKQNLVVLCLIIIFSGIVRLWHLGNDSHPLLWDETALGYTAFSIAKTGADEYGTKFPLILKSFGDYKPGLYAYTAIPPIVLFGLTEFAVRLPSAIAGVFIVVLIYLVSNELFAATKIGDKWKLGVFAAMLAVFNPWLVHFSRGAWESNLNLALTLGGVWAFLRARNQSTYVFLSTLLFGLTLVTYQSSKLFTPLILFGLLLIWGRELLNKSKKNSLVALGIFSLMALPTIFSVTTSSGRLAVMSAFSYPRSAADTVKIATEQGSSPNSLLFKIYHGQWLASTTGILERYFNHFSGRFLFYEGDWDNGRLGSPYVGQFYWLDLFFLLAGVWFLAKQKEGKSVFFLLYWVAISPLPAALSRDVVQAVRSLNLVAPLIILASLGLATFINLLTKTPLYLRLLAVLFLLGSYAWNISYYLDSYFIHAPVIQSRDWLYGYKETVETISQINSENLPIIFTQKYGQPYIYVLFYDKIDPSAYQAQARLTENPNGDVGQVERFSNFNFRNIYWPEDRKLRHTFFVGTEDELPTRDIDPKEAQIIKDITRPDRSVAFRIVETY